MANRIGVLLALALVAGCATQASGTAPTPPVAARSPYGPEYKPSLPSVRQAPRQATEDGVRHIEPRQ